MSTCDFTEHNNLAHQIIRIGFIPHHNKVITRLANVFPVFNLSMKSAGLIQPVINLIADTNSKTQLALQITFGPERGHAFKFDTLGRNALIAAILFTMMYLLRMNRYPGTGVLSKRSMLSCFFMISLRKILKT